MFSKLTERQKEILEYCSQGFNNDIISKKLQIEKTTLKAHFNSIYKSLQIDKNSNLNKRVVATIMWRELNPKDNGQLKLLWG